MSRTRRGSKAPGVDYWSKRPGNWHGGATGKVAKQITHRIERQQSKAIALSEKRQAQNSKGD